MKKSKLLVVALMSLSTLGLSACGPKGETEDTLGDIKPLTTKELVDFTKGESEYFETSDGWSNGGGFNCTWSKDNVVYNEDGLNLKITEQDNKFNAGEIRTRDEFGYGDYSVSMKPLKVSGTVSSFFIYTGESFGTLHNEIDIEFLGKDTTKLQFNYFTDGKGNHEYVYDLGFDASLEYHDYGFRWTEEEIIWFVDNKAVYKATDAIPMTPGRIFMNSWCGNKSNEIWMGKFNGPVEGESAKYKTIGYQNLKGEGYVPTDKVPSEGDEDITLNPIQLTLKPNSPNYNVVNEKDSTTVTYENISNADNSYQNIDASLPENSEKTSRFSVKIKNNGTTPANVRLDITDGVSGSIALNQSATQDGKKVKTDLTWGGSFFLIAPGKTVECVINYKPGAKNFVAFLDSFGYQDTNKYSGNITFSEFKIGGHVDEQPKPDVPEEKGEVINFTSDAPAYTIDNKGKSSTVEFTKVKGNSYSTIYTAFDHDVTNTNEISLKIKNLAETKTIVRIDVQGTGDSEKCINTLATQDGQEVRTDFEWGGSFFTLEANQESTCVIKYPVGKMKSIICFINSSDGSENETSGKVEFKEVTLTEGEEKPNEGVESTYETVDFTSDEPKYVINNEGTKTTVTYDKVVGNTYKVVFTPFKAHHELGKAIEFKLKNLGTNKSTIRVDVQGKLDNQNCINTKATQDGKAVRTDFEWGGSFFNLEPNQESTCVIEYPQGTELKGLVAFIDSMDGSTNEYSGKVELKDFKFIDGEKIESGTETPETTADPINLNFLSDNPKYTITNEGTSTNIKYDKVLGNSYSTLTNKLDNSQLKEASKVTFKIKNNGSTLSNVRVDIHNSSSKFINISGTMNGNNAWTDLEWGGTFYEVNGNEEVTCVINFTKGEADLILLFVGSSTNKAEEQSGDITVSNFIFE